MRSLASVTTSPEKFKVAFLRNTLISVSLVLAVVPLKQRTAAPAASLYNNANCCAGRLAGAASATPSADCANENALIDEINALMQ